MPTNASSTSTTTPVTKPVAVPAKKPAPAPAKPTVQVVTIQNKAFAPLVLVVKAGDTVEWINKDTVPHTTITDGALVWDSGTIYPGGSWKRVFNAPGGYNYSDGIYPDMHAEIIVR